MVESRKSRKAINPTFESAEATSLLVSHMLVNGCLRCHCIDVGQSSSYGCVSILWIEHSLTGRILVQIKALPRYLSRAKGACLGQHLKTGFSWVDVPKCEHQSVHKLCITSGSTLAFQLQLILSLVSVVSGINCRNMLLNHTKSITSLKVITTTTSNSTSNDGNRLTQLISTRQSQDSDVCEEWRMPRPSEAILCIAAMLAEDVNGQAPRVALQVGDWQGIDWRLRKRKVR